MTETEHNPTPPFVQKDMRRAIPPRWLAALIITAVLLAFSVYPGKWLSMQPVFAQIFAPRGIWIVISFLALIASTIVFAIRWHRNLPRRVSALFMAITMVATFAHVSIGWGDGLRVDPLKTVATPNKGYFGTDITVMSLNSYNSGASPVTIAKLANSVGADIVMLSETTKGTAKLVAQLMEKAGSPMQMFQSVPRTLRGSSRDYQTILLVSVYFGTYEVNESITPDTSLGAVTVVPQNRDANFAYLPTIVAGHVYQPNLLHTGQWRHELKQMVDMCHGPQAENLIMAGDMNATPWHGGLADMGACVDALAEKKSGSVGTWPTYLPRPLGVPIDHIFVSKSHWHTAGSTVADVSGTDHRAVLTRLTYSEM